MPRTIVCIASGPSLTAADCALVRASQAFTIVVNTSFRLAPWADVLYAGDREWWHHHGAEALAVCAGARWTASLDATERHGVRHREARDFENSGYQAIELAVLEYGARRVVLLGYDMQHTGGRRHWHADHPAGMPNADEAAQWPARFSELPARFAHVEFVNASRATALTCFRRADLAQALRMPA